MTDSKKVINNSIYLYGKMCITMFISLYTVRLLLNALGVVDYGIYNVIGGIVAIFGFFNTSMVTVTQRFLSYYNHNLDTSKKVFNISIVIHFIIALFIILLLESVKPLLFEHFINIPTNRLHIANIVYHISVISTAITITTVPYEASINAHENMLYFSVVGIIESILKLSVALTVIYTNEDKLLIYALGTLFQIIIILMLQRIYCRIKYTECKLNIRKNFDKNIFLEMMQFLGWSFINQFSLAFSGNGINLILNHFFGPALNAAQSVTSQLRNMSLALAANIMKAFSPVIVKSEGEGDRQHMLLATMYSTKYSCFLFLILGIPIFLNTEYILSIWLKNIPEWCVVFTKYIMLQALLERLFYPLSIAISAQGKIKGYSIMNSTLTFFQLPCLFIAFYFNAAPYWLYIIQIVLSNLLTGLGTLYFSNKNCNLKISHFISKIIIPITFSLIIALTIGYLVKNLIVINNLFLLIVFSLFIDIIYITLFYITAISTKEKLILKDYLTSILTKIKQI